MRITISVFAVVAIVLAGGWWLMRDSHINTPAELTPASGKGVPTAAFKQPQISEPVRNVNVPSARNARTASSIYMQYVNAADKWTLFQQLSHSRGADGQEFYAARLVMDCKLVAAAGPDRMRELLSRPIQTTSQWSQQQREAVNQMIDPCVGFYGQPTNLDPNELIADAAQAGDRRAQVLQAVMSQSETNREGGDAVIAAALLDKSTPGETMEFVSAYMRGRGKYVIDGAPIQEVDRTAASVAWQLVACDYGVNCGPSNGVVLRGCVSNGVCYSNSLERTLQDAMATPSEFDKAIGFLGSIRMALRQGNLAQIGLATTIRQ